MNTNFRQSRWSPLWVKSFGFFEKFFITFIIILGKTTAEKDVEAGEKDELLEKKEGEKSDELEEVKVVSGDEEAPADGKKFYFSLHMY